MSLKAKDFPFSFTYRVPYAEVDQMGVVYYTRYLEYFERFRNEYLRFENFPYKDLESRGYMLPVIDLSCRYKSPAYYDDELIFAGGILAFEKNIQATFKTNIYRGDKLLVDGWTKHVFISTETKKLCTPEQNIIDFMSQKLLK